MVAIYHGFESSLFKNTIEQDHMVPGTNDLLFLPYKPPNIQLLLALYVMMIYIYFSTSFQQAYSGIPVSIPNLACIKLYIISLSS